jgi:hypothetical protein
METQVVLWNAALSFVSAVLIFVVKTHVEEVSRVSILLSKTREEHAEKFVTRSDVHHDINRVIHRLDKLDEKLDAFMKEQRSALG